jgi:hypothetical protein
MLRVKIKGKNGHRTIEAKPIEIVCENEKDYYWYEYQISTDPLCAGRVVHNPLEGDDDLLIKILMDIGSRKHD